jgi:acetate kinase
VLEDLEPACAFAPLHDPAIVRVIREGMARFPHVPHYACFDTVFHMTMPEEATTYPIPLPLRQQGIHRYGFHGLSCESIVRTMQKGKAKLPKRMVLRIWEAAVAPPRWWMDALLIRQWSLLQPVEL